MDNNLQGSTFPSVTAPNEGKRARRVADTRLRIIDVSLDLFVARGFAATTIEDIAEAAGIGRSSFFRYFEGKDTVVFAPMTTQNSWFLEQLAARPAGERVIDSIVEICIHGEWPELRREDLSRVQHIVSTTPDLVDTIVGKLTPTFSAQLHRCIRARAPRLESIEVKVITDTTMSWIDWSVRAHVKDGRPLHEHFTQIIAATAHLAGELIDVH